MSAKDLVLRPIPSKLARDTCKKLHYSHNALVNSTLHFGVFWNGKLEGVMQFGPSLIKKKMMGLVRDTGWNEFIELNRMAFSDALPRNSESRALSIAIKLIRKYAPQIKWIVSFSDGCQSGDGCIYRASGFVLTLIKKNVGIYELPNGAITHLWQFTIKTKSVGARAAYASSKGSSCVTKFLDETGIKLLEGYQLRYIYFIDKNCKEKLTVPIIPFSDIDKLGAGMYLGKPRERSIDSDATVPTTEGGATPTRSLQLNNGEDDAH